MDRKATFISLGIFLWAAAALLMHFVGPVVFDGGLIHILFWIANFFVPVLFLPLIAKLTGRTKHDMLAPTALMAAPAMTLDGISTTLDAMGHTHIYANTTQLSAYTGGFLLFAFASFFVWAMIWHR